MKNLMMAVLAVATLSAPVWSVDMGSAKMQDLAKTFQQILRKQENVPYCDPNRRLATVDSQGVSCWVPWGYGKMGLFLKHARLQRFATGRDLKNTPFGILSADGVSYYLVYLPLMDDSRSIDELKKNGAAVSGDEILAALHQVYEQLGGQELTFPLRQEPEQ